MEKKKKGKGDRGGDTVLVLVLAGMDGGMEGKGKGKGEGGDKKKRKEWGTSNHIHSCTNTPG